MIDTHCHLTDPRLLEQLDDVLARAAAAGVSRMVTIGTDIEDDQQSIALASRYENVRCAIGIHPNYVTEADRERVHLLRGLQASPGVVALGEMGLDYHYDRAPRGLQKELFEAQLAIAAETARPVVIHCREAVDDTLAIMKAFPGIRAVFHCFTGRPDEARRIVDAGYLLGFTGPVTYKKNDELRAIALACPIDRMVVETDAPYLSPEPVRKQKTNEPSFVVHTAAVIAAEKQMSLGDFDAATTRNALDFYGWTP